MTRKSNLKSIKRDVVLESQFLVLCSKSSHDSLPVFGPSNLDHCLDFISNCLKNDSFCIADFTLVKCNVSISSDLLNSLIRKCYG